MGCLTSPSASPRPCAPIAELTRDTERDEQKDHQTDDVLPEHDTEHKERDPEQPLAQYGMRLARTLRLVPRPVTPYPLRATRLVS